MLFGDNDFSAEEIDRLFADDEQETPPADNTLTDNGGQGEKSNETKTEIDTTKAFSKRLKESTAKAVSAEREAIAKQFGYDSYDTMMASRDSKKLEEKGLSPEDVLPIVNEMVDERIKNDPRMKELDEVRNSKLEAYGKQELQSISELTNGQISKFEQLPKDTIELWKKTGSLKQAYLALHGEEIIKQTRNNDAKGSMSHLNSPDGSAAGDTTKRPLTASEKAMYKFFNKNISDDELNKITVKK